MGGCIESKAAINESRRIMPLQRCSFHIHGRFATKTARTKCNGFGKSKELAFPSITLTYVGGCLAILNVFLALIGHFLAPYEAILAPYRGMLAPFEAILAPCEPILGSCWAYVGPILTHFWPIFAQIKNFDPF